MENIKDSAVHNNRLLGENYIDWLYSFLLEHNCFDSDTYCDELSQSDVVFIKFLGIFYKNINSLLAKKGMCPIVNENIHFYQLSYNNLVFEIGTRLGEDNYFFCSIINNRKDCNYIDLNEFSKDLNGVMQLCQVYYEITMNAIRNGIDPDIIKDIASNASSGHVKCHKMTNQ